MFLSMTTVNFFIDFFKFVSMHFVMALLHPLFVGLIFLIYILYKKTINGAQFLLGDNYKNKSFEVIFESIMYGILAGFIISIVVNFFGIHLQISTSGFMYLWIVVLVLSFFNIRYLCFSYAGGLLALTNLFFGWPHLDVSGLIAVIAILHLIEGVLIATNGHKDAVPAFVKHKNKVVGAFIMQKHWIIPITLLTLNIVAGDNIPGEVANINEPGWWPLMQLPNILDEQAMYFMLLPIPAVLGYSEIAITDSPRRKARKSGLYLSIYSVILLILAVISSYIYYVKYIAAFFALIAHELLILYWKRKEETEEPYFGVPSQGVRILEVMEDAPAQQMGLIAGDNILRINNKQVMTRQGITTILDEYPTFIWVDVLRDGKILTFEYKNYRDGISDLGILIVPRDENVANVLTLTHYRRLFKNRFFGSKLGEK